MPPEPHAMVLPQAPSAQETTHRPGPQVMGPLQAPWPLQRTSHELEALQSMAPPQAPGLSQLKTQLQPAGQVQPVAHRLGMTTHLALVRSQSEHMGGQFRLSLPDPSPEARSFPDRSPSDRPWSWCAVKRPSGKSAQQPWTRTAVNSTSSRDTDTGASRFLNARESS